MILARARPRRPRSARRWRRSRRPGDVITLSGPLGVGKTALGARLHRRARATQGDVPSPSFAIVQPYEELDPPVWHVDLYRIEDPSEIEELGLDAAARRGADGRMARAGRASGAGPTRSACRSSSGRTATRILTAEGPPVMGGAMASPMIPPPHAPDFLAACGLGRRATSCRSPAMRRSAAISASFSGDRQRGADGRAAAARGPAAVHRGRRMADRPWAQRARKSSPATSTEGLLLLGDFGDARLRETLDDDPARERELYELATDVLVHLHRHPPMPGLRAAWPRPMARRADAVHRLVLPGCRRSTSTPTAIARPGRRCSSRSRTTGSGRSPVLRDYHAENIMLVEGREGVAHLGLLDFQDALAGHPAYDLASVLEDARRDVPPEIERAMIDRYVARDRTGRGVRAGLLGARGAAQHAHPRRLHAAVEARRQAALPALPAAHVGAARARPRAARVWSRCATGSTPISRRSIAREPWRRRHEPVAPALAPPGRGSGRGSADGDDHGRRSRQADAAADRDARPSR